MSAATGHDICVCVKCGPPWRNSLKLDSSEANDQWGGWAPWMALCPRCGSKRCSGAIDHDNECDGGS